MSARIGLMTRQGPHQTAWKSTTTGSSDSSTSAVKRASVVSIGMPITVDANHSVAKTDPLWLRSGQDALALRTRDQLAHAGLVTGAQQLHRVGLAVDDPLEERLAVLVGRQRALRPSAHLVEDHREARVLAAELLGDLALDPLGQRGRRARRGDRDRERTGADDRRQDEVAQRGDVDDVDEHRAPLRVFVDAD